MADDEELALQQAAWAALEDQLSPAVQQRQAQAFSRELDRPAWHLVILPDLEPEPQLVSFDSFEALVAAVQQLRPADWGLPFYGWLVRYSAPEAAGGLRFLVHPAGHLAPLFQLPTEVPISRSFFLQGHSAEPDDELSDLEDAGRRPTAAQRHAARAAATAAEAEPDAEDLDEFAEDFDLPDAEDLPDEHPGLR